MNTTKISWPKHSQTAENWAWLDAICGKLDQDFVNAATEQPAQQERIALTELFK